MKNCLVHQKLRKVNPNFKINTRAPKVLTKCEKDSKNKKYIVSKFLDPGYVWEE